MTVGGAELLVLGGEAAAEDVAALDAGMAQLEGTMTAAGEPEGQAAVAGFGVGLVLCGDMARNTAYRVGRAARCHGRGRVAACRWDVSALPLRAGSRVARLYVFM